MADDGTPPQDPNPDALDPGEPFSHFLQLLRGSVRPLATLTLLTALTVAFIRIIWTQTLAEAVITGIVVGFSNLASGLIGMWFGQRR